MSSIIITLCSALLLGIIILGIGIHIENVANNRKVVKDFYKENI